MTNLAAKKFQVGLIMVTMLVSGGARNSLGMTEKDIHNALSRAFECEQKQDYEGAIRTLTGVPSAGPEGYKKNLSLGRLYYLTKQYDQSELSYEAAINTSPKSIEARTGLLLPLLAEKKYERALLEARTIHDMDSGNEYARKLIAALSVPEATAAEREASARQAAVSGPVNEALTAGQPASIYVAGYAGLMKYRNTTDKDRAILGGLYGSVGNGLHFLESEVDYTHINNSKVADIRQTDISLAYANYGLDGWRLRLGGHLIQGNDAVTQDGLMLFGGARYSNPNQWALGVDGYRSSYPHYNTGLDVTQVTADFGLQLLQGNAWSLWNNLREYWIGTSADVGFSKDSFWSTEDRVTLRWTRSSFAVFGWQGEQVFAGRNDGLTIFNLAEKHKSGLGIEAAYAFTDRLTAKLVASRESFEENGSTQNASADMVTGMLVLGL